MNLIMTILLALLAPAVISEKRTFATAADINGNQYRGNNGSFCPRKCANLESEKADKFNHIFDYSFKPAGFNGCRNSSWMDEYKTLWRKSVSQTTSANVQKEDIKICHRFLQRKKMLRIYLSIPKSDQFVSSQDLLNRYNELSRNSSFLSEGPSPSIYVKENASLECRDDAFCETVYRRGSMRACYGNRVEETLKFCVAENEELHNETILGLSDHSMIIHLATKLATADEATKEMLNNCTALLQALTADSTSLSPDEVKNIADFLIRVGNRSQPLNVEIEANLSLRYMAKIISQLAQGVWNHNSSRRRRNPCTKSTLAQQLQLGIAKKFPAMCLRSALARNTSHLDITTRTFFLRTSSVNLTKNQNNVRFRPVVTNEDSNKSYVPISLSIPRSVVASCGVDSTEDNSANAADLRMVFIYYHDDTFFPSNETTFNILSVDIGPNETTSVNFTEPISIVHHNAPLTKPSLIPGNQMMVKKTTFGCVFWNFTLGNWSTEGCCLNASADPPECLCYHLTNFALLVKSEDVPANLALSITSAVGCYLSIFGLLCTILLLSLKKELRKFRSGKILLHLCSSLMASYIVFVAGVSNAVGDVVGCAIVTGLLHYLFLATWCWMCVYSYEMHNSLVKVFAKYHSGFMSKASVVCYTVPAFIASITAGLIIALTDSQSNSNICGSPDTSSVVNYYASNACWLKDRALYYGFLLPVAILLLYNFTIFLLVSVELKKQNHRVAHLKRSATDSMVIAVTMTFIMGLTWIFAFLMLISTNEIYYSVTSWLFAIFNTLQGFGIFLLTFVRREDMRNVWVAPILKLLQICKQSTVRVETPSSPQATSKVKKTSTSELNSDF